MYSRLAMRRMQEITLERVEDSLRDPILKYLGLLDCACYIQRQLEEYGASHAERLAKEWIRRLIENPKYVPLFLTSELHHGRHFPGLLGFLPTDEDRRAVRMRAIPLAPLETLSLADRLASELQMPAHEIRAMADAALGRACEAPSAPMLSEESSALVERVRTLPETVDTFAIAEVFSILLTRGLPDCAFSRSLLQRVLAIITPSNAALVYRWALDAGGAAKDLSYEIRETWFGTALREAVERSGWRFGEVSCIRTYVLLPGRWPAERIDSASVYCRKEPDREFAITEEAFSREDHLPCRDGQRILIPPSAFLMEPVYDEFWGPLPIHCPELHLDRPVSSKMRDQSRDYSCLEQTSRP